jgi:hypothetical protein
LLRSNISIFGANLEFSCNYGELVKNAVIFAIAALQKEHLENRVNSTTLSQCNKPNPGFAGAQ